MLLLLSFFLSFLLLNFAVAPVHANGRYDFSFSKLLYQLFVITEQRKESFFFH